MKSVLRACAAAPAARAAGPAQQRRGDRRMRIAVSHGSSPLRNARRGLGSGPLKKRAAGRSATHFAAFQVDHARGQALGLAEVVGAHHQRHAVVRQSSAISASTSRLAAGSRLAVGSSRNSTLRPHRPGTRQRQALLLAARQRARRPRAPARPGPTRCSAAATRCARSPPRHAGQPQREAQVVATDRRSRKGRWNTIAWATSLRSEPGAARRRPWLMWRASGRAAGAAAWSCPSRWRRPAPGARRGAAAGSAPRSASDRRRSAPRTARSSTSGSVAHAGQRGPTRHARRRAAAARSARLISADHAQQHQAQRRAPAAGRPCWSPARWRWS